MVAALTGAGARANEGRVAVDWAKLGDLLRAPTLTVAPVEAWRTELADRATFGRPGSDQPLLEAQPGLGRYSVVARDFDGPRLVMGRLSATDQVRRGRSRRMMLLRGRLSDGPVTPFVQLGLGQYRVAPDVLGPPHPLLLAGQAGAGIELSFTSWASLALEGDCTLVESAPEGTLQPPITTRTIAVPDPHASRLVTSPAFWGGFLAFRAAF
jgi:hypothetical protein